MGGDEDLLRKVIAVRTYSRVVEGKNRKESEKEIYHRVLNAFESYYIEKSPWLKNYYDREQWFKMMYLGMAYPAGRMLWSMGSETIKKEGFLSLMNCSFIVIDDPIEPLKFILKMLILGCGVGFSLEAKYFKRVVEVWEEIKGPGAKLSEVSQPWVPTDQIYYVEDSKEGWIEFAEELVRHAITGNDFCYSLEKLRPAGSPIKGFGGVSGDPRRLAGFASKVWDAISYSERASVSLYYDIICWIAELVISGNVRRSALIAIGDPDDEEFLSLKDFEYINKWKATQRYFCNNSVNIEQWSDLGPRYWETFRAGTGEPYGWVNVKKARERDELHDVPFPPQGFNPCGEQPLHSREVCCLGEIILPKIKTEVEAKAALTMTYLFCKLAYTLGAPTEKRTEEISHANQRIGISLSGIGMDECVFSLPDFCEIAKPYLEFLDDHVSRMLGVNKCVALTTIKPGGTLSKLAGCPAPGIHRPISRYQIRRVRFSRRCSLVNWFPKVGIYTEPDVTDPDGTVVASFYLHNGSTDDGAYSSCQTEKWGFINMLARVRTAQLLWSDNSVSVTVLYNPEWTPERIAAMVKPFAYDLKCFSALPYFGHGFKQAPEEPISDFEYYEATARRKPVDLDPPLDLDGIEDPEDFGGCRLGSADCSDR